MQGVMARVNEVAKCNHEVTSLAIANGFDVEAHTQSSDSKSLLSESTLGEVYRQRKADGIMLTADLSTGKPQITRGFPEAWLNFEDQVLQ